jgi:hypothetical protein
VKLYSNNNTSEALTCFPNTARDYIEVKAPKDEENINIYDLKGTLFKIPVMCETQSLRRVDICTLNNGIYIIKAGNQFLRFIKE